MDERTVTSTDELVDAFEGDVGPTLSEDAVRELYEIWETARKLEDSDLRLLAVSPFYTRKEYGRQSTPILLGTVTYDDPDKGAVLFEDLAFVDTNIAVNEAFDVVTLPETLRTFDVSGDSDYIDQPGKDWLPRGCVTCFQYREPQPDNSITQLGGP